MAENKKYLDMPGLTYFYNQIKSKFASKTDVSTPLTASAIAAMTDHDKVYVYTGSETGHTFGDWYYYEDGSWHSAGQYRANVYETDKTLSVADKPADGKKTGDEISDLKSALIQTDTYQKLLNDNVPDTIQYYTFSDGSVSKIEHKSGNNAIRSDVFVYDNSIITEKRTLNTGESLTIKTNLTTLETSVTYTVA